MDTNLQLKLVETKEDLALARHIVTTYHTYVNRYNTVGRKIDWLIYYNDEPVGVIGLGSSTYPPCKDMLDYLGITKEEYRKEFNSFANNWRFCLKKPGRDLGDKNLGCKVLKQLRTVAVPEWKRKYGDDLKYIITFVGAGYTGSVYRQDNWECIGKTAGLPTHKSVSMKWDDSDALKQKFVKPTGDEKDKKLIFIKKL